MRRSTLVARNALRPPLRFALTAGAVAILVVVVVVLVAILDALEADAGPERGATRIVIQHATGLASFLPRSMAAEVARMPGVVAAAAEIYFAGTYIDTRPEHIFGQIATDPTAWSTVFPEYRVDAAQLAEWRRRPDSLIAGRALVDRYGWSLGDRVRIRGTYIPADLDLTLVGIYTARNESNVYFHARALDDTWIGRSGQAGHVVLRASDPRYVGELTARIEARYENSRVPVVAMPERQFRLQFVEMLGDIHLLFLVICGLALASTVLIVANTLAASARERCEEFATLRALGFSRTDVVGLAVGETLTVALAGACVGLPLSVGCTLGLRALLASSPAATFAPFIRFSAVASGAGLVAVLLAAALASAGPVWTVARLRVPSALRQGM
jgi:putative ABC transport system permease protein